MPIKDWLRAATDKAKKGSAEAPSVEDLINLERYEEALTILQERVRKRSDDHRSRLKLAELQMRIGRRSEAVDSYLKVSEGFERDGFYDKANALVAKVARLLPDDERVRAKAKRLDRMKRMDHLRKVVAASLPQTLSLKIARLWTDYAQSDVLGRLTEEQLRRTLPNLSLRELKPEEEYVSAGVRRDELVWIVSGEICARVVLPNGSETDIRCFQAGTLIGDRALFEHQPWPAVYVASKATTVFVLDRDALERSLKGEENPRGLLEALRSERNDEAVIRAVAAMSRPTEGT